MRWVMLLVAFYVLGVTVFGYHQMQKMAEHNTAALLKLDPEKAAKNIDIVIDARINLLRAELRMRTGVILSGSVGFFLLIVTLFDWKKRHAHWMLKAKLLEVALENKRI
jgi:hypothetical protein